MGLLDKTNPAATPESVRRVARVFGIIGATLYLVACIWVPGLRDGFFVYFPASVIAAAALGALLEWQNPDLPSIPAVVARVEKEFDVRIDPERAQEIVSVGDLLQSLRVAIQSQHPHLADELTEEVLRGRLKPLIANEIGVDKDEVVDSARFHYELQ